MKASLSSIGALAAGLALFVGVNSALAAGQTAGRGATVASASSSLGRILVDARGRTLYLFARDNHGKSACNGQCVGYWPPLIASGEPRAGVGVKASLLGTTKRSDGRLQVTYNRHPLYTFVKDTRKGQTNGEGLDTFGAQWFALSPTGAKIAKAGAAGGGYGGYPAPGGYGN
jgi:predicted lipoprotein with Yx(FWY)xxD motif